MSNRVGSVVGASLLCALLALGCGSEDEKAKFAEACSADGDCASGMFCAREGSLEGFCTSACSSSNTEVCANTHGSLAYCSTAHLCALKCDGGSCPSGLTCYRDVIPDTCASHRL